LPPTIPPQNIPKPSRRRPELPETASPSHTPAALAEEAKVAAWVTDKNGLLAKTYLPGGDATPARLRGDAVEENTLTVLLIEDSPQFAQLVQHWLANTPGGAAFVLNWTDSLADGLSRLDRGGVDVILLDLGLPDCDGMETFKQASDRALKTPIVILSSADSESLALQMIQEGAEDYLVKSSCDAESLARAVRRAVVRRKSHTAVAPASSALSRVISVVGAKGGSGTTTIACTLAAELRQQTGQKILIADLDSSGGLVSFLSGVECQYSIRDAISNMQRLDTAVWESLVSRNPDGLEVISSPNPGQEEIDNDRLREVLAFTRPLYAWTVIDLGRLNHKAVNLLGAEGEVFVVTAATIPALYNAKRAVETLLGAAIDPDRIRLIVNHIGGKPELSGEALQNMFGVPVFATVPSDASEVHHACVQKRLPGAHSHIRKAIGALARKMTGIPEQRKGSTLTSLVSFARFRRPSADAASSSN
jgi:Flp pilus assembly CpaE family ATPase